MRAWVRACVRVLLLFSCKLIGDFLALFRDCDDALKDSIASALRHSRREGEKTYDRRTCQEKKQAALDLAQAGSCRALEDEAQAQEDSQEEEQQRAVLRMRSRQWCWSIQDFGRRNRHKLKLKSTEILKIDPSLLKEIKKVWVVLATRLRFSPARRNFNATGMYLYYKFLIISK